MLVKKKKKKEVTARIQQSFKMSAKLDFLPSTVITLKNNTYHGQRQGHVRHWLLPLVKLMSNI